MTDTPANVVDIESRIKPTDDPIGILKEATKWARENKATSVVVIAVSEEGVSRLMSEMPLEDAPFLLFELEMVRARLVSTAAENE